MAIIGRCCQRERERERSIGIINGSDHADILLKSVALLQSEKFNYSLNLFISQKMAQIESFNLKAIVSGSGSSESVCSELV